MSVPIEEILKKVGKWIVYADQDLALARHALTMESCPFHLAAFHAQQCAEKYFKVYLVFHKVDFPYTHNLRLLIESFPPFPPPSFEPRRAVLLRPYAITARYPGEEMLVSEPQAVEAIEIAAAVRASMRRMLMEAACRTQVETLAQQFWPMTRTEWMENHQPSENPPS